MKFLQRSLFLLSVLLVAAVAAPAAFGSAIIGRNMSRPSLTAGLGYPNVKL